MALLRYSKCKELEFKSVTKTEISRCYGRMKTWRSNKANLIIIFVINCEQKGIQHFVLDNY